MGLGFFRRKDTDAWSEKRGRRARVLNKLIERDNRNK